MYIGEKINFAYTGGIQEFVAPDKGLYLLEAWGARGGDGGALYGYGGYSKGYVVLDKNERIYIVVGGAGGTINGTGQSNRGIAGGYNGGGYGYGGNNGDYAGSGGGATHFARSGAILSSTPLADVFIIAGGGGGGYRRSGTQCYGGNGGGLTSGGGRQSDGSSIAGSTQTSGGPYGQGNSGHTYAGGGGGGGYFGGYASLYCGASGGSGYIDGAKALTYKGVEYVPETTTGGNGAAGKASITFIAKGFRDIYAYGNLLNAIMAYGVELDDIRFPEDLANASRVSYHYDSIILRTRYINEGEDILHTDIEMPTKEGYTFVGWALQPDSLDIVAELTAGNEPINLHAVYLPNQITVYNSGVSRDDRFTSGSYSSSATANSNSASGPTATFNVNFHTYQTGEINCSWRMSGNKGFGAYYVNGVQNIVYAGTYSMDNIKRNIANGSNRIRCEAYADNGYSISTSFYVQSITLSNPKPWV